MKTEARKTLSLQPFPVAWHQLPCPAEQWAHLPLPLANGVLTETTGCLSAAELASTPAGLCLFQRHSSPHRQWFWFSFQAACPCCHLPRSCVVVELHQELHAYSYWPLSHLCDFLCIGTNRSCASRRSSLTISQLSWAPSPHPGAFSHQILPSRSMMRLKWLCAEAHSSISTVYLAHSSQDLELHIFLWSQCPRLHHPTVLFPVWLAGPAEHLPWLLHQALRSRNCLCVLLTPPGFLAPSHSSHLADVRVFQIIREHQSLSVGSSPAAW